MIDLRCCDVAEMLASLPDGCASLVMADPPWLYNDDQGATFHRGSAAGHYDVTEIATITNNIQSAARVGMPDCYLFLWCTFPKLGEWFAEATGAWRYITGGCWGKINGLGVGHHFRGDAELLLLYKQGTPQPRGGPKSNLWLADRVGHSEKPQKALRALVEMACPPDGLVVDLYAGASASLAIACRSLGRNYVGAEIDPRRHELAVMRLSQQEMSFSA